MGLNERISRRKLVEPPKATLRLTAYRRMYDFNIEDRPSGYAGWNTSLRFIREVTDVSGVGASNFTYRAFISYSHRDEGWAKWLHNAIEGYRVPKSLIGRSSTDGPIPKQIFPVFRDRDELPACSDLSESVRQALSRSARLIVLCSPSAAQSRWVNREIAEFKRLGHTNRILAVIVDGEPHATDPALECFPEGLRFQVDAGGHVIRGQLAEPIAADLRPAGDGKDNAKLKLLAGLLGVSFNDLRQRELIAARRRARIYRGIAAMMLLLTVLATLGGWMAWRHTEYSEKMLAKAIGIAAAQVNAALRAADSAGVSRVWIERLLILADSSFNELYNKVAEAPWVPWRTHAVSPLLQSEHAKMLLVTADHYGIIGNVDRYLENAMKARDIFERLVQEEPLNVDWRHGLAFSDDVIADALNWNGQLQAALDAYRASLTMREGLAAEASQPPMGRWQRDVSLSKNKIGDVLRKQGHLQEALNAYQEALAVSKRLAGASPSDSELQRDVLVSQHKIGDILAKQEQWEGAETAYQESLAIAERLATADPANAQSQRDLATSHEKVGNALVQKGQLEAALVDYRASLVIAEQQATADPTNAVVQRDLSLGHEKIGNVLIKEGDIEGAVAAFRATFAIRQSLVDVRPGDSWLQRDLSVTQSKLGEALEAQGKLQDALAMYRASLAIRARLVAGDSSNAQSQRDLSLAHDQIARVLAKNKQLAEAINERRISLAIAKGLADAHPSDSKWQWELSISHNNIGDLLAAQGKLDQALESYENARRIRQDVTAGYPSHIGWQRALAESHRRVGAILTMRGDMDGAIAAYRLALELLESLAAADPSDIQLQQQLNNTRKRLAGR